MKIVVLNGSPKGRISVTMQYVEFLQKKCPQHELIIFDVAQEIRGLENGSREFQNIINAVKTADGVLWAFPLYVMMVHANYKRFIELIEEQGAAAAFRRKHAAIFSTSIKYFDYTAHNYMHAVSDDFGMKVYGEYSAEMNDLFNDKERTRLLTFFTGYCDSIARNEPSVRVFPSLVKRKREYVPGADSKVVDPGELKVVIISDDGDGAINIKLMIDRMRKLFGGQAEVINLRDIDIKGGCLGCLHCGYDNKCVYEGKDGFVEFYNTCLKPADILIFAGTIRDRYFSSVWKNFFDRAFFNNHVPSFPGKQMAFLVSGPLRQIPNLRQIFEVYCERQHANLVGIATDETNNGEIDRSIEELVCRAIEFARQGYVKPATFLQVGGSKIFRDAIWGRLRFPFIADHKYYKTHGMYDFPQNNDYGVRLRNLLFSLLVALPPVRKEIYRNRLKEKMVKSFRNLLAKL